MTSFFDEAETPIAWVKAIADSIRLAEQEKQQHAAEWRAFLGELQDQYGGTSPD
jgi:hypothetical protein